MMWFLDANVILRYLTNDVPAKAERCLALFQRADRGEIELTTSEAIIAEVVYVLSSPRLYNLARGRIRDLLCPILALRGLRFAGRRVCQQALDIYAEQALDFEDALAVAHMRSAGIGEIVSYDRHFDGLQGIVRREP